MNTVLKYNFHKKRAPARRSLLLLLLLLLLPMLFLASEMDAQVFGTASVRLIGTIEGKNFYGAVFQDAAGKQLFYQLNETLPDGSKIIKVREDSISLKGPDGVVYDMYIAHDTKSAASSEQNSTVNTVVQQAPAVRSEPAGSGAGRKRRRLHSSNYAE